MSWDTASVDPRFAEPSGESRRVRQLLWAGAFALALAAVGGWLWHVHPQRTPSLGNALVPARLGRIQRAGTRVVRWQLAATLPAGWSIEPGVRLAPAPGGGVTVLTTPGKRRTSSTAPRPSFRRGSTPPP